MRGKIYTKEDKEQVKKLILEGKSYKEIEIIQNVPKSTISTWFGKTIDKPWQRETMLEHLSEIRVLAVSALKNKWQKRRKEEDELIRATIEKDLKIIPIKNIGFYKSLLAMLYWAEGSKHKGACGLKFANTDPKMAKLYVALLRKCYHINENKFSVGLHLHYYHSHKKVKDFWSKILDIPVERFYKTYVKKRSKTRRFRKNFAGICFIYYGDSRLRKELLSLSYSLQNIIAENAPVA